MTTKLPTGRGLLYCLQFSNSLLYLHVSLLRWYLNLFVLVWILLYLFLPFKYMPIWLKSRSYILRWDLRPTKPKPPSVNIGFTKWLLIAQFSAANQNCSKQNTVGRQIWKKNTNTHLSVVVTFSWGRHFSNHYHIYIYREREAYIYITLLKCTYNASSSYCIFSIYVTFL